MDNAFPPRVCAIEGEGEGLKCGDGEMNFFLGERGKSGMGADRRRKKKA